MGFGYGPGNEMQKSQKGNRSLLRKRKSLKELQKENGSFSKDQEFKFKKPTKEELEDYKEKLKIDARKDRIKRWSLFSTAILIGLILLYLLTSVPV